MSDEVWSAYRASLGTTPVSVALGRLVEREVTHHRRRTGPDAGDVREAVEEARGVADELVTLIARFDEQHPTAA